jgi:glycosyltransferase involved in cell wall biosynthesis
MKVLWPHNFSPDSPFAGKPMRILVAGMRDLGIDVHLEYLGILRNPLDLSKARRTVRNLSAEYDLVHSQFGSACALACVSARSPKVLSLRGSDWHIYKGRHLGLRLHNELAAWMSRISLKHYDKVIVMSNRMAKEVSRFSPTSSVHVIPDAVDDIFFERRDRKASRALLGYPSDETPWVLFTTVSIDNPIKRASLALDAINHLRRKGQKVELRVASGIMPVDMPVFVSSCDVVLCTSTHEGWPNSVKEALACGLPFVSTDISDMKMISEKYPACRVVSPDSLSIADAIMDIIQNKSKVNLRESVELMSIEKTCHRLKILYESIK